MDYNSLMEYNEMGLEEYLGRQTRMLRDSDYEDVQPKTPLEMVREYHEAAGLNLDVDFTADLLALRWDLIEEEWEELNEEFEKSTEESSAPLLKEMCDLIYVLYGWAATFGYDLDEALRRVHKNNMDRMYQDDGTIKRREDGKILRNKKVPPPKLDDLV